MDRVYSIDMAEVVSDVIDGEAVMLHRLSGDYFSTDGIGCQIWQWIGEGQSRSRIVNRLKAGFVGDPAEIERAVDSFLDELVIHKLAHEAPNGVESTTVTAMESDASPKADFVPPALHVYSDIRNMIVLDPVHDLSDEADWPAGRRPDDAT